jgi:hypothetical protein
LLNNSNARLDDAVLLLLLARTWCGRYRSGLLKDHGPVADLLALTGLLAEDNPLFTAA